MIKEFLSKLRLYAKEGLFHIFGSSVLAQVGGLISSAIVVHRLPKAEYGYYTSANNKYSYLAIFIGLGLTSAIIQYCSERVAEERKNSIYRHSLITGSIANVLICLAILAMAAWVDAKGDTQVAYYLRLMCGLPFVVYANHYLQVALRVKLKNQAFSYANMMYALVMLVGNILFSLLLGIPGLILSNYLANGVAAVMCAAELRKECFFSHIAWQEYRLPYGDRKEITIYALVCALTNFASTVLVLLDVTCLDMIIGDSTVLADYKVASTIPSACTFVPSCLMTFFYPKIVSAFSAGKENGRQEVRKLTKLFLGVNGLVFLALALGAPLIIYVIFGAKYMNVVPIFEILSLNYLIYSVRSLLGNVIAVIKRVKINLLLSVISGVVNIVLNIILIQRFGSVGAALATLIVTTLIGTMSFLYLQRFYKEA